MSVCLCVGVLGLDRLIGGKFQRFVCGVLHGGLRRSTIHISTNHFQHKVSADKLAYPGPKIIKKKKKM